MFNRFNDFYFCFLEKKTIWMKKILLLISMLIAIIILFNSKNNTTTIKNELSDFAIEDTSIIQQVFFADKLGNSVTISKENGKWFVNNTYPARNEAVEFMLKTMADIQVKHPVSNSLHDRIVKNMASSAVKVEIYTNNNEVAHKTYYVGEESKDLIGSYMLLENSKRAFVVYIPGFNGFLAPRYTIDGSKVGEDLWRDRTIFSYNSNEIKSISVENHDDSELSFKMYQNAKNFSFKRNGSTRVISNSQGEEYFNLFKSVKCEGFMNNFSKKDSILNSKAYYTIRLTLNDGTMDTLTTYHKEPKRVEYLQNNGQKLDYDPDRMYAKYNSDLILIQFYIFDKIFLRTPQFTVEK